MSENCSVCGGYHQSFSCAPKPFETGMVREWIIDDSYALVIGPHPGQERIVVVEKSAYDKLQQELSELKAYKQGGVLDFAGINVELRKQLSSARREVEEWKAKVNDKYWEMDLALNKELTQERARSAELLSALERISKRTDDNWCQVVAKDAINKHNSGKGG